MPRVRSYAPPTLPTEVFLPAPAEYQDTLLRAYLYRLRNGRVCKPSLPQYAGVLNDLYYSWDHYTNRAVRDRVAEEFPVIPDDIERPQVCISWVDNVLEPFLRKFEEALVETSKNPLQALSESYLINIRYHCARVQHRFARLKEAVTFNSPSRSSMLAALKTALVEHDGFLSIYKQKYPVACFPMPSGPCEPLGTGRGSERIEGVGNAHTHQRGPGQLQIWADNPSDGIVPMNVQLLALDLSPHYHPNVGPVGQVCFGDGQPTATHLMQLGRFPELVTLIKLNFLPFWGTVSPFWNPVRDQRCAPVLPKTDPVAIPFA